MTAAADRDTQANRDTTKVVGVVVSVVHTLAVRICLHVSFLASFTNFTTNPTTTSRPMGVISLAWVLGLDTSWTGHPMHYWTVGCHSRLGVTLVALTQGD